MTPGVSKNSLLVFHMKNQQPDLVYKTLRYGLEITCTFYQNSVLESRRSIVQIKMIDYAIAMYTNHLYVNYCSLEQIY